LLFPLQAPGQPAADAGLHVPDDCAIICACADTAALPCVRIAAGVEICGALKNVLAIAAGIVEGLELGHNALAALIAQGCAEIRWLCSKVGAKPATISGLSGLGDIMLTCYGDLSRNRAVGVRLGRGEALHDILASSSQVCGSCCAVCRLCMHSVRIAAPAPANSMQHMTPALAVAHGAPSQVAEGVATAGVVVGLARKYRVSLPVLTAVAQVLDNNLAPAEAVAAVMNLPQIEER
jgi:glycerol-3-phosphate dehydrogenase (NAD+)